MRRRGLSLVAHAANEVVLPRSAGLDVLGPDFEHLFEVDADIRQSSLQKYDHVLVVLSLLIWTSTALIGLSLKLLQCADLLVQTREILLDHKRQLVDLHRSIVEHGLPPREFA